jgi:hypothetical protein
VFQLLVQIRHRHSETIVLFLECLFDLMFTPMISKPIKFNRTHVVHAIKTCAYYPYKPDSPYEVRAALRHHRHRRSEPFLELSEANLLCRCGHAQEALMP